MAIVLAHDVVRDRTPDCSPRLSEPLWRNKTRIRAEYVKLRLKQPKTPTIRPLRYARVNTLLISTADCIREMEGLGLGFEYHAKGVGDGANAKEFWLDEHIQDLLVFAPGTDLTDNPLYKEGKLILQDKASCMPVALLQPPVSATVVDACAAPGNKTTQLAASVGPTGAVYAFERDPKRAELLQKTLRKHGCDAIVTARCQDFLRINPADYADVEYALVDPSCSGSGMLESFEMSGILGAESSEREGRLQTLSNFQCMILRHAMRFPNVKRVVYSTCSVHREENEEVVRQVLAAEPQFRLCRNPLPLWHRRGLGEYDFGMHNATPTLAVLTGVAADVIRADPVEDRMNGFFVACFEKMAA